MGISTEDRTQKNIYECCTYVHRMDWSSRSEQKTHKIILFCNNIHYQKLAKNSTIRHLYIGEVFFPKCSRHFIQSVLYKMVIEQ